LRIAALLENAKRTIVRKLVTAHLGLDTHLFVSEVTFSVFWPKITDAPAWKCWCCYPAPSEEWGCGGTHRDPTVEPPSQGLDQRSKMKELVPNMAHRTGSDSEQSRRRWVRSCRWCP